MSTIYKLSAVRMRPTWRVFVFGLSVCGVHKVSVNLKTSVNCSDHHTLANVLMWTLSCGCGYHHVVLFKTEHFQYDIWGNKISSRCLMVFGWVMLCPIVGVI